PFGASDARGSQGGPEAGGPLVRCGAAAVAQRTRGGGARAGDSAARRRLALAADAFPTAARPARLRGARAPHVPGGAAGAALPARRPRTRILPIARRIAAIRVRCARRRGVERRSVRRR